MKNCDILLLVTDANMYETGTINEKIISNDLKKTQNACIQFTSVTFGHILRHNLLYCAALVMHADNYHNATIKFINLAIHVQYIYRGNTEFLSEACLFYATV